MQTTVNHNGQKVRRKSSDACWPLRNSAGQTWSEAKAARDKSQKE